MSLFLVAHVENSFSLTLKAYFNFSLCKLIGIASSEGADEMSYTGNIPYSMSVQHEVMS